MSDKRATITFEITIKPRPEEPVVNVDWAECPICLQTFSQKIFVCIAGHSVCETCKVSCPNCPFCRQGFSGTRNFYLEALLDSHRKVLQHINQGKVVRFQISFTYRHTFYNKAAIEEDHMIVERKGDYYKFLVKIDHEQGTSRFAAQALKQTDLWCYLGYTWPLEKPSSYSCRVAQPGVGIMAPNCSVTIPLAFFKKGGAATAVTVYCRFVKSEV